MATEEGAGATDLAPPVTTTKPEELSDNPLNEAAQNGGGQPNRVKLSDKQKETMSKEELLNSWKEQDLFIDLLESQSTSLESEATNLRESLERLKQQYAESQHKEKVLVRRLASKEQEMQDYASQLAELRAAQVPSAAALRSALLDPAASLLVQKLRQELSLTKTRLEETQNELSAWKFTPDSNTGKRLMAKCRLLYQENEELGRVIASGRLAKLEGELALQKSISDEVRKSQSEMDEFLQELDEGEEGMQGAIYVLQQQLKTAMETITNLSQENNTLRQSAGAALQQTEKLEAKPVEQEEESRIDTEGGDSSAGADDDTKDSAEGRVEQPSESNDESQPVATDNEQTDAAEKEESTPPEAEEESSMEVDEPPSKRTRKSKAAAAEDF